MIMVQYYFYQEVKPHLFAFAQACDSPTTGLCIRDYRKLGMQTV